MTLKQIVSTSAVVLALAAPAFAQEREPSREEAAQDRLAAAQARQAEAQARQAAARERQAAARQRGAGAGVGAGIGAGFRFEVPWDTLYEQARSAIESNQFQRALDDLNRALASIGPQVAAQAGNRADAAMYWKAYSQSKLDLNTEALATVAELAKQFAQSPWLKDAKALALEIQQANGQPISLELQNDEELKLLALQGLMRSDPDKGVPIIEKMLAGGASPRVRERALFVLSQNRSARAHDVMLSTAKNNANPDLQRTAIRYLGMMGGAGDRDALAGVYRTATDSSVKRAILQSYAMSGNVESTAEAAKSEKDVELRRLAIRNLGMMNKPGSSDALVSIYKSDTSADIRRTIVNSLFMQQNAKALVELARAEKDPSLKKEIVSKLAIMKAPEATEYMLELLK